MIANTFFEDDTKFKKLHEFVGLIVIRENKKRQTITLLASKIQQHRCGEALRIRIN